MLNRVFLPKITTSYHWLPKITSGYHLLPKNNKVAKWSKKEAKMPKNENCFTSGNEKQKKKEPKKKIYILGFWLLDFGF